MDPVAQARVVLLPSARAAGAGEHVFDDKSKSCGDLEENCERYDPYQHENGPQAGSERCDAHCAVETDRREPLERGGWREVRADARSEERDMEARRCDLRQESPPKLPARHPSAKPNR